HLTVHIPLHAILSPATLPSSCLHQLRARRSPARIAFPLTTEWDFRTLPDRELSQDRRSLHRPPCSFSTHRGPSGACAVRETLTFSGSRPPTSAFFLRAHTSAECAEMFHKRADADVLARESLLAMYRTNHCQLKPRAAGARARHRVLTSQISRHR